MSFALSFLLFAASPGDLQLAVDIAPGAAACGDAGTLRRAFIERYGERAFSNAVSWRVSLAQENDQWIGSIAAANRAGEVLGVRRITSRAERCRPLVATVELALGIALRHLSAQPASLPATLPDSPRQPLATSPIGTPVTTARPSFTLGLGPVGSFATLPSPTAGLALGAGVVWSHASAFVEGWGLLPAGQQAVAGAFQSWLVALPVGGCWRWSWLSACGVLAPGALTSNAPHVAGTHTVSRFWLATGPRVETEIALSPRLSIVARGDLWFALTRITVFLGDTQVWRGDLVNGSLSGVVQVRFP